jgi:Flp pilus assembly protein TadG
MNMIDIANRTLLESISRWLKKLCSAKAGNVIIPFALTIIPIIGFVGAAVDYSRANSAKAAMQAAVDATALILSKDAQSLTTAQLNQKATAYFNALFNRTDVNNILITPTFTTPAAGSFRIEVTGTGQVPTTFTKLLGQQNLNIDVNSQVLWGIKKLQLALALDNTGSMSSSSKMTELKKAAHSLLDTLKKAAGSPGDVKVAIIPFDTTVNIGTSYKDQPWFDVSCAALGSPWGCSSSNWKPYWEGCVRDRTQPYDAQDTSPTASAQTLYPIYDCGSLTKIMPLSYDWTALNTKIDAMQPNGNTNVTIGLVWAWHALTTNTPLTEGAAPAPDLDKVIILLTDGDNTEAWNNSNNTKITSQSTIDARTALTCENIKAANIKIYAVRVIDGDAPLLKGCASSPNTYFDVQNASQLNSVFTAIAQNLANLRIAK